MSFTLLGDEFSNDADLARLSDAAVRTHVDALVWSSSRLLDLKVPKRDLSRFAFSDKSEEAVTELCAAGWWLDRGDHYEVVHRSEWQWSSAQHEARKLSNRRASRHKRGDHSLCRPGSCLALSADESAADTHADVSAGIGEERQGQAPNGKRSTTKVNAHGVGTCRGCKSFVPIVADDLCESCIDRQRIPKAATR
jgi:hypothetical protein